MNALHNVGRALRRATEYGLMAVGVPVLRDVPVAAACLPVEGLTPMERQMRQGTSDWFECTRERDLAADARLPDVNPSTGYPMTSAGFDAGGYAYGEAPE